MEMLSAFVSSTFTSTKSGETQTASGKNEVKRVETTDEEKHIENSSGSSVFVRKTNDFHGPQVELTQRELDENLESLSKSRSRDMLEVEQIDARLLTETKKKIGEYG